MRPGPSIRLSIREGRQKEEGRASVCGVWAVVYGGGMQKGRMQWWVCGQVGSHGINVMLCMAHVCSWVVLGWQKESNSQSCINSCLSLHTFSVARGRPPCPALAVGGSFALNCSSSPVPD